MTEPSKNPGELPTYHGICPYCASAVSCVTRDGMTYARCSHRGCGARGPYHRDLVRAVELFTRMDHPTRAHATSDVVAAAYRRGISDMLAVAKEHAGILFRNEPDDICINWTRVDREAAKLAGENGE